MSRVEIKRDRTLRHVATTGDLVTLCGVPTFGMSPRGDDQLPICAECVLIARDAAEAAGVLPPGGF